MLNNNAHDLFLIADRIKAFFPYMLLTILLTLCLSVVQRESSLEMQAI